MNNILNDGDFIRSLRFIKQVSPWTFAKTYAYTAPHEYIVRETICQYQLENEFNWFISLIREYGKKEKFYNRSYIYLCIGNFKYWTMGSAVNKTRIINRASI